MVSTPPPPAPHLSPTRWSVIWNMYYFTGRFGPILDGERLPPLLVKKKKTQIALGEGTFVSIPFLQIRCAQASPRRRLPASRELRRHRGRARKPSSTVRTRALAAAPQASSLGSSVTASLTSSSCGRRAWSPRCRPRRAPCRIHGCFDKLSEVTRTVHGRVHGEQEAQQPRHGRWPPRGLPALHRGIHACWHVLALCW